MSDPIEVLDFWLGEVGPEGWYTGGDALDAMCRVRFFDLWSAIKDGGLEHWVDGTVGTLAYIILSDQLPRNMFRGQAGSFATDPNARRAAHLARQTGWDMQAPEPERQFFYLPFMHSEDVVDQTLSVKLFTENMPGSGADNIIHAKAHQAVIAQFGRFPFRNPALGRSNTVEEDLFMANGAYGAIVRSIQNSYAPGA